MSKKKNRRKKSSVPNKVKHAQRINDLRKKIYWIFVAAGAGEVFRLIPQVQIDVLLMLRIKPFTVEAKEGADLTPDIVDFLRKTVVKLMQNEKIKLSEKGSPVSLYDYMYVGERVRYFLRNLKESDFPDAKKVLDAFQDFFKITNEDKQQDLAAIKIAQIVAYGMSNIRRGIITLKLNYAVEQESPPIFYNRFIVDVHQPPMVAVKIDDETRKAHRLIWLSSSSEVTYTKISLDKIGLSQQIKNLKADVYIQRHALDRMEERLDCIIPELLNIFLIKSVMECNVVTNEKGKQLIEFRIDNEKVGYLIFNYTEGIIVIRTFLLITNNDTPEGEKLERQLGVEKLDKQYLGIDKLSAFAISDIEKNPTLKKAFEKAGCNGLFNISKYISEKDNNPIHNAEKIAKYLELSKASIVMNECDKAEHPAKTFSINV